MASRNGGAVAGLYGSILMRNYRLPASRKVIAGVSLLALAFAVSANVRILTLGEEDKPKELTAFEKGPGLRGVLPEEPPEDLSLDAFNVMGENNQDWSDKTSEMFGDLYFNDELNAAGQRKIITELRRRQGVLQAASTEARFAKSADELRWLAARLDKRLTIMEAVLNLLEKAGDEVNKNGSAAAVISLNNAVALLAADLSTLPDAKKRENDVQLKALQNAVKDSKIAGGELNQLRNWRKKVAGRSKMKAAADVQFYNRRGVLRVNRAIGQVLAAADAASGKKNLLRTTLKEVVAGIEAFELTGLASGSEQTFDALGRLTVLTPHADVVAHHVRQLYANYNVQLIVGEGLVNRLLSDVRNESGQVRDFILGANIYGRQNTNVNVFFDLQPSSQGGLLNLTLSGLTRSNTVGVTSQANIYTSGRHSFYATKGVHFNGASLSGSPARITITPRNTTTGAKTVISWIPLLGGLADNYAVGVARGKRAQSERIASTRVRDKVLPRMEKEARDQLAEANGQLNRLRKAITDNGLALPATLVQTTGSHLRYSGLAKNADHFGGSVAPVPNPRYNGGVVQIHATLLNNGADTMKLAGRSLTEDEVMKEVEKAAETLLGRPLPKTAKEPKPEPKAGDERLLFDFDARDPIRFQFRERQILLTIRAGFNVQVLGKDGKWTFKEKIPGRIVTIPLITKIEGGKIRITRGTISVTWKEGVPAMAASNRVITEKVEAALKERVVDGFVDVPRTNKTPVRLNIQKLTALGNWLVVEFE